MGVVFVVVGEVGCGVGLMGGQKEGELIGGKKGRGGVDGAGKGDCKWWCCWYGMRCVFPCPMLQT